MKKNGRKGKKRLASQACYQGRPQCPTRLSLLAQQRKVAESAAGAPLSGPFHIQTTIPTEWGTSAETRRCRWPPSCPARLLGILAVPESQWAGSLAHRACVVTAQSLVHSERHVQGKWKAFSQEQRASCEPCCFPTAGGGVWGALFGPTSALGCLCCPVLSHGIRWLSHHLSLLWKERIHQKD